MIKNLVVLSLLSLGVSFALAQSSATSDFVVREQCYKTLKENLKESTLFSKELKTLDTLGYKDIEGKFSKNYKSLTSFGIDVDTPVFEQRIYSFGEQTGYIHPPKLPFPAFTKSEIWTEPAKENIYIEEYVIDPKGNRYFIDCGFIKIASTDLKNVTRERYFYEGVAFSFTKKAEDGSYKAWFNQAPTLDYYEKPYATTKRLFVYPKATQNAYFNKYDVQDVYLAMPVKSFSSLHFVDNPPIVKPEADASGELRAVYYAKDASGKVSRIDNPEMYTIFPSSVEQAFPLMGYYETIEKDFPDFSKNLSFRGTVKFSTFKKILSDVNLDKEVASVRDALLDFRGITAYYISKEKVESNSENTLSDKRYDKVFEYIKNVDESLIVIKENKEREKYFFSVSTWKGILLFSVFSLFSCFAIFYVRKRRPIVDSFVAKIDAENIMIVSGKNLSLVKKVTGVSDEGVSVDLEKSVVGESLEIILPPLPQKIKTIIIINSFGKTTCEVYSFYKNN